MTNDDDLDPDLEVDEFGWVAEKPKNKWHMYASKDKAAAANIIKATQKTRTVFKRIKGPSEKESYNRLLTLALRKPSLKALPLDRGEESIYALAESNADHKMLLFHEKRREHSTRSEPQPEIEVETDSTEWPPSAEEQSMEIVTKICSLNSNLHIYKEFQNRDRLADAKKERQEQWEQLENILMGYDPAPIKTGLVVDIRSYPALWITVLWYVYLIEGIWTLIRGDFFRRKSLANIIEQYGFFLEDISPGDLKKQIKKYSALELAQAHVLDIGNPKSVWVGLTKV